MQRIQVAPGAHVNAIPGERFKRFKINFHFVLPGDKAAATALSVLPHVLERRCASIPNPIELSRKLFSLYGAELQGESYTAGANRVLTLGISGLKNSFAIDGEDVEGEAANLLMDLLFAPKLSDSGMFEDMDVFIETAKQADFLRNEMNDKRGYCLRQARRKLYGASPLSIESAGYLEDIEKVTPAYLYEVYTRVLREAAIEVVVCGADAVPVQAALQQRLAGIQRTPVPPAPRMAAEGTKRFKNYEEPMDTVQGKLCILLTDGHVPNEQDEAVLRMASAVLGGLPTSRLFQNVREKQSLCYYCTSVYGGFSGTLQMDSGVDHAMAEKAAAAMLQELKLLQQELITEEEYENARKALANSFAAAKDSPDALAGWVFTELLRGSQRSLDEAAALLEKVTREDIRAALARFTPALQYTITAKEAAQ